MKSYLQVDEELKILDIGCNTGFFSFCAAELGHNVHGIDIDKKCIEQAIKVGNEKIRFIQANILTFLKKIPDNYFDYTFYLSVHHHIYEQVDPVFGIADDTMNEISRTSKNMFFDTGQPDEKDTGHMKWLELIPKMKSPRRHLISYVLQCSSFKYGEIISSTTIHKTERWLFRFIKKMPESLKIKELIINNKKYTIDEYMWKQEGSCGAFYRSYISFPLFDPKAEGRTRFYKVHDTNGKLYFIKEFFYDPDYETIEENIKTEYDRGQKIKHIPHTLPAIDMSNKFLVFEYFTSINLNYTKNRLKKEEAKEIIKTAQDIYDTLSTFDLNFNNILYKDGNFKFIDFATAAFNTPFKERFNTFKKGINWRTKKRKILIIFVNG